MSDSWLELIRKGLGHPTFVIGGILSLLFVRETREYTEYEAQLAEDESSDGPADTDAKTDAAANTFAEENDQNLTFGQVFRLTSWGDKALFSSSQAGLVGTRRSSIAG